MYPNLYYFFFDVFGIKIPVLKVFNSFGFFVAIAFLVSAWFASKEFKRRQLLGYFTYSERKITVGEPAGVGELVSNFLVGFVLGYKIVGIFFIKDALSNPQQFIFSLDGNWLIGILLGAVFAFFKWREKNKVKLATPETRTLRIWPSDRLGDIVIICAVAGFAGAKVFDNLENWDRFIQDPIGNLFSASGLTFYGGLIFAIIALYIYFKKNNISFINVADAFSPSLMLAYGLGRIGCQVAGDGDWGIINSAYLSNADGKVHLCTPQQFQQAAVIFKDHTEQFGIVGEIQHAAFKGVSWLPDWLFAYSYPHNVGSEGVPLANCNWGEYCNYLPLPVFPTPLYEIITCVILFGVLWSIRKKISYPGILFGWYLILNGTERFLIEHIRVNTKYDIPFHPSQAEIISLCLIIIGIVLVTMARKIFKPVNIAYTQTS
ncbi:diacylglyceryl transferase [Arachidicoccus ginsenosidimutans]|uniref:prolipoprotein diacylglyceryl transferase n=1 Tax=Arachidicoccus sp. BS20 TaxID=1850526 RepID=UPI0007F04EC1|nr:prolipoprotein diacylglyceryl transferase family protein [Arachidicoccus sp. BS20]ANI88793.1 diacylglyceryl transferase [Arachidicoccus sp. BS20]